MRTYTSLDGLIARAGRAHEDPREMTRAAFNARMAKYRERILERNPDLGGPALQRAADLLLRADMARLAARSAAARKAR